MSMAYVVTESCIKCKYTDCVAVCPVDCFHEGENMLVIDPGECIDCGACVPECPVEAIYALDDVPADQQDYTELNKKYSPLWPMIKTQREPMASAEEYKDKKGKRAEMSETPGQGG
jgi:ferredoxin